MNIFWGMKNFWIFFRGHHKFGLCLGVISMHFWGLFLKVKLKKGGIFLDCYKFKQFFGWLKFLILFF